VPFTVARSSTGRFLGASDELRRQYEQWSSLAAARVPLLIEGETGTGKELLAEVLHDSGPRARHPFVVFACARRDEHQLLDGLTGREGAGVLERGALELAAGGKLVIDEPAELGPAAQACLGALLERGSFTRVGGTDPIALDARIITTSRRDLDCEVQEGRFREDLLYRLAGATIELPPLRHRRGDVEVLARHFWSQLGGVGDPSEAQVRQLESLSFPGNVRDLLHAVAELLFLEPAEATDKLSSPTPGLPVGKPTRRRSPDPRQESPLREGSSGDAA
jgi:DNA-binding NtrC family response regulator